MYNSKLAVAIKHNGKILRETKDLVHLPFGSEFSVLVKNLNSRRAKFTLHIDGTDVLSGEEIIVNANSEVEMKRFIRNGNMNEGNAFKFIERTASIEDGPRGIKVDDGVIRVEFWFEQEAPVVTTTYHKDVYWNEYYRKYYPHYQPSPWFTYLDGPFYGSMPIGTAYRASDTCKGSGQQLNAVGTGSASLRSADIRNMVMQGGTASCSGAASATASSNTATAFNAISQEIKSKSLDMGKAENLDAKLNDAGITVPGSKVAQAFTPVYGFNAEAQSHVIILRMVGMVGNVEVAAPITVKAKQKCETCGKVNKATSKFCSGCGTALELL